MKPIPQRDVTSAMTSFALEVLHDVAGHPLGSSAERTFGGRIIRAVVETHTNGTAMNPTPHPHRGITLYDADASPVAEKRARGVDVSHFQGVIDWAAVAASGVAFAYVKATEGVTETDLSFVANLKGARAAGLLVGAYHFFRTTSDHLAQVRRFARLVGDAGGVDLPLALDVEWQHTTAPLGNVPAFEFVDRVAEAVAELAQLGQRRPLLYTAPGFWSLLPARPSIAAAADLWVAHYGVKEPAKVGTWPAWTFWQHSASGTVPGVKGADDLNVFRGSPAELRATYLVAE